MCAKKVNNLLITISKGYLLLTSYRQFLRSIRCTAASLERFGLPVFPWKSLQLFNTESIKIPKIERCIFPGMFFLVHVFEKQPGC